MTDTLARAQAQKQWNTTACGELPGDKRSLSYFESVERDRYAQQDWMHEYFRYDQLRWPACVGDWHWARH